MDIGQAVKWLKAGHAVTRDGWNGKNMFLVLNGGYSVPYDKLRNTVVPVTNQLTPIDAKFLKSVDKTELEILPHIDMWTATKQLCVGWLASQTDLLADDWRIFGTSDEEKKHD